jgi:molybdopterin converting factor small subunit
VPVLRLFAAAREAAGEARLEVAGATVGDVLDEARRRYGEAFTAVLGRSRVWVNGQPADDAMALREQDVVAVLPPVSGGAGAASAGPAVAPVAPSLPDPPPPLSRSVYPSLLDPPVRPPVTPVEPPAPAVAEAAPLDVTPRVPEPPAEPAFPSSSTVRIVPSPPPPAPESRSWFFDDEPPPPPLAPPAPPPAPERRFEPPPPDVSSPDDLLDRLAGLPPWPEESSSWYPDEPEPPTPPPPRSVAPEEPDDSLWGPGSGPVWSVGDEQRRSPARRDRADWADEAPLPPPDPSQRRDVSPFAPDEAVDAPSDPERGWDDVLRWDRGEPSEPPPPLPPPRQDPEDSFVELPPSSPSGSPLPAPERPTDIDDGPAVRIIGPDPFIRPAADEPPPSPPALTVAPPDAAPPTGSVLVRERPRITADRGPGGGAVAAVAAAAPAPAPAATPAPAPAPTPKSAPKTRPPLAVVPKSTRPHGRLGLLWVAVTVGAIVWTPVAAGIWFAACGGLAAFQTAKVWQARNEKPLLLLAGATAAALPLSAIAGLRAMTAAVVLAVVATLLARVVMLTKAPARDVALTLVIGVVIGLAVASVVLLRNIGLHAPLLLLAFAAAYDAGAYLVGTGASSSWEGPFAGIATLIPVTMLSAVILVPPFPEGSPLLLGLLAAVLAPCGPLAGSALLGERDANAPALRRLDSLLVMAPVWAWTAAAFLN